MRPEAGTGELRRETAALDGIWRGVAGALSRLEAIASDSDRLDEDALEALPPLQYELHLAAELAAGLDARAGAVSCAELVAALEGARDATAELAEALLTGGPDAATLLVPELRGALFRVRLARRQIAERAVVPARLPEPRARPSAGAVVATLLVVCGTVAFTGGAVLGLWPLWVLGLAGVGAGFLAYRP